MRTNGCMAERGENHIWHKRMEYLNKSYLCKLKNMAEGIQIDKNDLPDFCDICVESKQTRKPFQSRSSPSSRPLQLVHSSVCGPI